MSSVRQQSSNIVAPPARRPFTVSEYERLIEAGILREDDRVELINGEILEMTPIGIRHAACVNRLNRLLSKLAGELAIVSVQNPIQIGAYSEPQPDLVALRPHPESPEVDYYESARPTAADTLLVVEVADSSLESDRTVKLPLYAQAGIPEVWIVSLTEGHIEVYTQPENGAYTRAQRAGRGESLAPIALPDVRVPVDGVLVKRRP
jgi:Uma2 family endonuclease